MGVAAAAAAATAADDGDGDGGIWGVWWGYVWWRNGDTNGISVMVVNLVPLGGLKRWIKLVVSHRVR